MLDQNVGEVKQANNDYNRKLNDNWRGVSSTVKQANNYHNRNLSDDCVDICIYYLHMGEHITT